jgi:hypothetical protein
MSDHEGTRREGFLGWLVAVLATVSLLPFGVTSSNAPQSARPPAEPARSAIDGDMPTVEGTLDDLLLQALGLPAGAGKGSRDPSGPDPLAAIRPHVAIAPMILCVADPETSAVGFRFDLQLDALQKALAAHDYVLDRWSLPWTAKLAKPGKPGLLVFRRSEAKGTQRNLVVVYLVGEWMTSGIDRAAFLEAVNHVERLDRGAPADAGGSLPILGPVFTGSVDSLGLALRGRDGTLSAKRAPIVINFSALKVDVQRLRDLAGKPTLAYGETILGTMAMWEGLSPYLERVYGRKPKVAWLNETGTAFGVKRLPRRSDAEANERGQILLERTYYPFPTGIARVRDAYANATSDDGKRRLPVATSDSAILHFPSKDRDNLLDAVPRFDPGMQAPYAELALRQILLDIARTDYDVVGITATDHRDRVFLAQQIRRYAPRAQLVLLGGDLAHEHPDYRQALRGTIVASTYPMFPTNQQWSFRQGSFGQGSKTRHVFASQAGYALFNAVSCAMVVRHDTAAFDPGFALLAVRDTDSNKPVPFVEYGSPHADGTKDTAATGRSPPLWISVLGDQGVWPVQSTPVESCSAQFLIRVHGALPDTHHKTDTHDTHPFSLCFIVILQAVAAVMAYWAAGGFRPPGRSPARMESAVAWIRPLREWWSRSDQPDRYDSPKARRLFTPMLVGSLALWLQVFLCGMQQWAMFVLDAMGGAGTPSAWPPVGGELVLFVVGGAILLGPLRLPTRIVLGGAAVAVAWMLLHDRAGGGESGVMLFYAMTASLAGLLLLRGIVGTVARRLAGNRAQPIGPFLDNLLPVAVVVLNTILLGLVAFGVRDATHWLPWLTTTSWLFNGVSPLLPLITACLAIEVICRSELMRCWQIETSFVASSAGAAKHAREEEAKEKDELSYPISGMETLAFAKQAVAWLLLLPHTDRRKISDVREPAPHAYLLWVGLALYSAWLANLYFHLRPVYPLRWINLGITLLVLFGYLVWAVIFVQMLALRFRFFRQLRILQHEINDPARPLAAAFVATRRPQDEWLGRLLYSSPDDRDRGALTAPGPGFPDAGDEPEPPDVAARKRAVGIRRWVAFVGAQLRITALGLGAGSLLLFVAISSLPFQPRPWFQFTATLSLVAIGLTVVTTMVAVDANEVLSRIAGTEPGKVSLDWSQILKLAPWIGVPLVMVIGQTFPEVWNWFGVALESWRSP